MKKSDRLYKHEAFTMIELIMTIVVISILAALAMPRLQRDLRQESADNIISALRFTQHMALMDNVTDNISGNKLKWHRRFWRFGKIGCSDDGIFYCVGSDRDTEGGIDVSKGEAAVDPSNGKVMMGRSTQPCEDDLESQVFAPAIGAASPHIFLTKNYGIKENDSKMFGECDPDKGNSIGFDYLGRPHRGFTNSDSPDYSTLLEEDCNLTFTFEDGSKDLVITIEKETGHVYRAKN